MPFTAVLSVHPLKPVSLTLLGEECMKLLIAGPQRERVMTLEKIQFILLGGGFQSAAF